MPKIILLFTIFSLQLFILKAQNHNKSKQTDNADCINAIELKDTVFKATMPPDGFGKIMEIQDNKKSLYSFEQEHNTAWYKFTIPENATLAFEIVPLSIKDDYDFILYKFSDSNTCKDIVQKKIIPVRTCISRNNIEIKGKTGLSKDATEEYIHSGPGQSYSKAIKVNKGEIYYLVLDNVYPGGQGHIINLHYTDLVKAQEIIKEAPPKGKHKINLIITDKESEEPINAKIEIYKTGNKSKKKPDYHFTKVSKCSFFTDKGLSYNILISAKGYINYSNEIKINRDSTEVTINVDLEKIIAGKNFIIDNIFFYGNLAKMLPNSEPALDHLLTFLKDNPTVKIEIQGHVNWPSSYGKQDKKQKEFNIQLSNDRAKAVFDYLVKNKIDANRLTYKGYGSSRMLYPDAVAPSQLQQNRRVEIMVTAY